MLCSLKGPSVGQRCALSLLGLGLALFVAKLPSTILQPGCRWSPRHDGPMPLNSSATSLLYFFGALPPSALLGMFYICNHLYLARLLRQTLGSPEARGPLFWSL